MNEVGNNQYNVLLITAYFPPEISSSAQIYSDLARNIRDKGNRVSVLTSYPRLHSTIKPVTVPLDDTVDGINIYRVKHPAQRDNKILRGLEHFYIPIYYFKRLRSILSKTEKYDVIIIYIAPLPLCYLGKVINIIYKIPVILNFEEYHPQELTDVEFINNPFIISILKHIERFACKSAQYITVHSPGGIRYLCERGADINRIETVFNSIDLKTIDNPSICSDFKSRYNLEGKYLISYGGTLSPFQGLDKILDVAKVLLTEHPEVIFVIAGDGMEKEHLLKRIEQEHISNVLMIPFIPRDEYISFIKSSAISIVSLDSRMMSPVLPGKLAYLMGTGTPTICLVNPSCETARIISESDSGIVVNPENLYEFKEAIQTLIINPELGMKLGMNGRKYMEKHMTSKVIATQYQNIFQKLQRQK